MRAPLSWIREFTPVEVDPGALAERLSLSGLTVEEVVRTGEGIAGVVVGEVRAVREHPNADSLMLVRAFDGEAERDIVCGARNYDVGDRVPLALPGAKLPGGIEIGKRVVRGEPSEGMLCSAKELRVADDHSGILLLDRDAPLGKEIVSVLELDDVIFDFDITTNRGDLLSIAGIAREIAALYDLPFAIPAASIDETNDEAASMASVEVLDESGCPRYVARIISGVRVERSPWWMRRRLLACGMRPISNVVDVTNYVLLERGQPLHAFDLDRLEGASIVVRAGAEGEPITTLDGVERTLSPADVVISDGARAVAVAGVMGGLDTEVTDTTRRILLESAHFDPIRVRTTAARLGLRSEASTRFERGTDPELPRAAADRAAELFSMLAGGEVARGSIDVYPQEVRRQPITVRAARASMLIGSPQDAATMSSRLGALGFDVAVEGDDVIATPPTWRPDISEEVDLVEEIARLGGFDRVPVRLPAGARTGGLSDRQSRRRAARALMLGAGLNEAQTLSLLPPWLPDRLGVGGDHPLRTALRVANPLSEEESVLRPSLVPGLLLAAQRNVARRVLPVSLFEIGVVFSAGDPVAERWSLGFVLAGPAAQGWHAPERPLDFFDGKGVLEALLEGLGVQARFEAHASDPTLHPGRSAAVAIGDRAVGVVAELHPRAADAMELAGRVVVGEIDLDALLDAAGGSVATAPPRMPAVARDVALVVPETTPAADVARVVREAAGQLLDSLSLFDVYRGEPVPEGSVSLAYALALRDPERTLTDADADAVMARVADAAVERGWTLRD